MYREFVYEVCDIFLISFSWCKNNWAGYKNCNLHKRRQDWFLPLLSSSNESAGFLPTFLATFRLPFTPQLPAVRGPTKVQSNGLLAALLRMVITPPFEEIPVNFRTLTVFTFAYFYLLKNNFVLQGSEGYAMKVWYREVLIWYLDCW